MRSRKRIRSQLYFGVTVLAVIVLLLSAAGFQGVLKYRKLAKSTRERAKELPLAAELHRDVSDLRASYSKIQTPQAVTSAIFHSMGEAEFREHLLAVRESLAEYKNQLQQLEFNDSGISDTTYEQNAVALIEGNLLDIQQETSDLNWLFQTDRRFNVGEHIDALQNNVSALPGFMKDRMEHFASSARTEYHAWMVLSGLITLIATLLIAFIAMRFHRRIFRPLEVLLAGSRQVAAGNYDHRIQLNTDDEMAELGEALNAMTSSFQAIQCDLNQQVQQRTKEVVRSEKMASVGFLAAGVAHEINNPLASIAWSAESLENRIQQILDPETPWSCQQREAEIQEMKKYLRRIQDEAFRCKGITSSLLDFSRLGDCRMSSKNLTELVCGVVEMVRPLGKYREKTLVVDARGQVNAWINEQEIKQVVLNLLTNALDSTDDSGHVTVAIRQVGQQAELAVADNGCGMTGEVLHNVFEPFFTRRQDGQGTGLGLSITFRIVEEHGGTIRPHSDGPGKGSTFTVTLPLAKHEKHERKAA